MILLLFWFGLALGAPSESTPDGKEMKLQLADHGVKLLRGNCPAFWYSFNSRCYKYVSARMTWADAELHCVSQGANLASIHSLEEHQFVKVLISNFDPTEGYTWIGLTDLHKEGGWMWSDGSPVDFTYWTSNQPDNMGGNEHCVHKNFGMKWNDNRCSESFPFVCATRCSQ
ncbi:lactose-binding lectin l-2-like [Oreochromis niloticus]|uniref:lactose-binding lectin l-2-like n=1 Tax=Oreochromis niloticus TaxID=8128 RepID=UPI000904CE1E|nr:lactose-binding lectin l-2-like [Oreochromis niloticus]